ncbi:MAG: HAD family hydrolase [Spirochaetes bacterium]|nr:HAD family hydrolase [Spirochaetota bacterium]
MIFVTDFDGTLFRDDLTISSVDLDTFEKLGNHGVIRVIATGRSYHSALRVIPQNFPIDYLVFSSGAGIMEWKNKEIIKIHSLNKTQIEKTVKILKENKCDFMLHDKIPDNHCFYFHKFSDSVSKTKESDFDRRCSAYSRYGKKLTDEAIRELEEACQFIVIFPYSFWKTQTEIYEELKEKLKKTTGLHIIRTTSPMDKKSLWVEIFPEGVSKALGIKTIADLLLLDYNSVAAVGNDFNDLDMLKWAKNAFVVENAPAELKEEFITVKSNNENGFTDAVNKCFGFETGSSNER